MSCSTIVENPLQIGPFLQNKANFRKAEMYVSLFSTKDYERIGACGVQKSKAKQSQSFDFAQDRLKPVFMRLF
jgi:hypothetical protein